MCILFSNLTHLKQNNTFVNTFRLQVLCDSSEGLNILICLPCVNLPSLTFALSYLRLLIDEGPTDSFRHQVAHHRPPNHLSIKHSWMS